MSFITWHIHHWLRQKVWFAIFELPFREPYLTSTCQMAQLSHQIFFKWIHCCYFYDANIVVIRQPHLFTCLALSRRPWSHTLSLTGYLSLPRPRHSPQREQSEFECAHWCIAFQFLCHPIQEDCKWDEGRHEFSTLAHWLHVVKFR